MNRWRFLWFFLFLAVFLPVQVKAEIYPVTAGQGEPAAAYNYDDDQFFLVWSECRNIPTGGSCSGGGGYSCGYGSTNAADIYGQLINGDGGCLGGNFLVSTEPVAGDSTGQSLPNVVYNPNNHEYLVVWQGHKRDFVKLGNNCEGAFQEEGFDIFGQRFTSGGVKIGPLIKISDAQVAKDDQQWHPVVSFSTQDNVYLVAWHDGRTRQMFPTEYAEDNVTFKDIYGQIVRADGTLQGANFPISVDPGNTTQEIKGNARRIQQYASIAYDSTNNRFLVVFEDDRLGQNSSHPCGQQYDRLKTHIYGAFFDTQGQRVGDNFPISQTNEAKRYAKVAYNPYYHEYLVVWQGANQANPIDIANCPVPLNPTTAPYPNDWVKAYAQRINASGEKIGEAILIDNQTKLHNWYYDSSYAPQIDVTFESVSNKYLVTWGNSGTGSSFTIRGKLINPEDGSVSPATVGDGFTIGTSAFSNLIYFGKPLANNYLSLESQDYTFSGSRYRVVTFKKEATQLANCPSQGGPPESTPYPSSYPTATGISSPSNTIVPPLSPTLTPTPIPGDSNRDNCVDMEDFEKIRIEYGIMQPGLLSDFNNDGQVDLSDFLLFKGNFGVCQ